MPGRTSKIQEYGVEEEVVELLKQGLGPKVIADLLNKRHSFPIPLNHVNVIGFRDSLAPEVFRAIKEEHLDRFYVKPIEKLRGEMQILRESVFPNLVKAVEAGDTKAVRVLSRTFMDTWDRIARIEEIINPTGEMKAKVVHIQQQFNLVKDHIHEIFSKLCPECRQRVLESTANKTSPAVVELVEMEDGTYAAPEASEV